MGWGERRGRGADAMLEDSGDLAATRFLAHDGAMTNTDSASRTPRSITSIPGDNIDPKTATHLRVFTEDDSNGLQWNIDAASPEGYTDEIWTFDTFEEAIRALPSFVAKVVPHLAASGA